MPDAAAEVRYQTLRGKLNDLNYYQPLSSDSCVLAEKLLLDLVESIERSQALKRRCGGRGQELLEQKDELKALQLENPQLQAENNGLHSQLIDANEEADRLEGDARLRIRCLEDDLEATLLSLRVIEREGLRWEHELQTAKERILHLLPNVPVKSHPRAIAPAIYSSRNSEEDSAPQAVAIVLRMQAIGAEEALRDCKLQTEQLIERTLERRTELKLLEEEAASASVRLNSEGPDLVVLRRKTEARIRWGAAAKLREVVAQGTARCVALEQRYALLESELRDRERFESQLDEHARALRVGEARAADRMGQLLCEQEEALRLEEDNMRRDLSRLTEVREGCILLNATREQISSEVDQASRRLEVEELAYAKQTSELQSTLAAEVVLVSEERASLETHEHSVRVYVENAQKAEEQALAAIDLLEAELRVAQESAESCVDELSRCVSEIEATIQGGALLQQHNHRSGAQAQLLNSSLQGLKGERDMLDVLLQEAQASLHRDTLQGVALRLETQRLAAIAVSHEDTHGEWRLDLDLSTASLRRAQANLQTVEDHLTASRWEVAQLRRRTTEMEFSEEDASEQRSLLKSEVVLWSEELSHAKRRFPEVSAKAALLRNHWHKLEAEHESCVHGWRRDNRQVRSEIVRLHSELVAATSEEAAVCRQSSQDSSILRLRIDSSENDLATFGRELETLLFRHAESVAAAGTQRNFVDSQARAVVDAEVLQGRRLEIIEGKCENAAGKLAAHGEAKAILETQITGYRAGLSRCEAFASEVLSRHRDLEDTLARSHTEVKQMRNAIAERGAEVNSAFSKYDTVAGFCDKLRLEVLDLVSLVSSAESNQVRIGDELNDRRRKVEREESERGLIESEGTSWLAEQKAAEDELEALRLALFRVDAERDGQQRIADLSANEIQEAKRELSSQEQALLSAGGLVDALRSFVVGGKEQLVERRVAEEMMEVRVSEFRAFSLELSGALRRASVEAASVLDDLTHMTRENQKLHEETRVLEHRIGCLAGDARRDMTAHELSVQELRAIELEHDDIASLYQQVARHARQQALVLDQRSAEAEAERLRISNLEAELIVATRFRDECDAQGTQARLDSSVLASQLMDIDERLAHSQEAHLEFTAREALLEGDVTTATVICQGASRRESLRTQMVASLGLRRQQLEASIRQAREEVAKYRTLATQGSAQAQQIEGLLETERRRTERLSSENDSFRMCLSKIRSASMDRGNAGSVAPPTTQAACSTSIVRDLRLEVERRYAEIAELDAEQQRLAQETSKLQALLREPS